MKLLGRTGLTMLAGLGLALTSGCQTWVPEAGLTLPTPYYLRHPPTYFPPSPPFPLQKELNSQEEAAKALFDALRDMERSLPNRLSCVMIFLDKQSLCCNLCLNVPSTKKLSKRSISMPEGKVVFAGLNQTGLIVFIVLLVMTGPCLCWLPWLIDSMKGDPNES